MTEANTLNTTDTDGEPIESCGSTACGTCPWLRSNHGKKHSAGWYTKTNLRRLWGGMRQGENMICHATDPNSITYGGDKLVQPGHERPCVGALVLVKHSFNRLEELKSLKDYKTGVGQRMSKGGMVRWAERIMFAGTAMGGPELLMPNMQQDVGVPWQDDVLNLNSNKKEE